MTAVHEVGHWFNLFHPFEGGCHGSDYVSDTPPSKWTIGGCPVGIQTCGQGLFDPIHNYMMYTVE
jgi:hypothetical protein